MTTYQDIQRILIDNGIPFNTVKKIGGVGKERTLRLEIFQVGIALEEKMKIVRNLLAGESCIITSNSNDEIISIVI